MHTADHNTFDPSKDEQKYMEFPLDKQDTEKSSYHIGGVWLFRDDVDTGILEKALSLSLIKYPIFSARICPNWNNNSGRAPDVMNDNSHKISCQDQGVGLVIQCRPDLNMDNITDQLANVNSGRNQFLEIGNIQDVLTGTYPILTVKVTFLNRYQPPIYEIFWKCRGSHFFVYLKKKKKKYIYMHIYIFFLMYTKVNMHIN
ncbi:hypothetical protein RFI_10682, partial [Reticulomyxa filosa]